MWLQSTVLKNKFVGFKRTECKIYDTKKGKMRTTSSISVKNVNMSYNIYKKLTSKDTVDAMTGMLVQNELFQYYHQSGMQLGSRKHLVVDAEIETMVNLYKL